MARTAARIESPKSKAKICAAIAAELERHGREQHGLARAGGTHNEGVADIANMKREAEGRRSSMTFPRYYGHRLSGLTLCFIGGDVGEGRAFA